MKPENTIRYKSKKFAVRIVSVYRYLTLEKHEYVMSKQLLRCGTSIGANIAESECAVSRNDFVSKVYIALKECSETAYWLELLLETDYLNKDQFQSLYNDCMEMKKMMQATTRTMTAGKHL